MAYLSAFLAVWKPPGPPTRVLSNVLCSLLRKKAEVGHIGTLDAPASGVVPLALGKSRLLIPYLSTDKVYRARIKFCLANDTGDSSGEILEDKPWEAKGFPRGFLTTTVKRIIEGKTGVTLMQRPHHISAVRVDGTRAYKLARQAAAHDDPIKTAEMLAKLKDEIKPRSVTIYSAKVHSPSDGGDCNEAFCQYPEFVVDLHVSSGFYVRSFVEQVAQELSEAVAQHQNRAGSGSVEPIPATLAELKRLSCGVFTSSEQQETKTDDNPLHSPHPLHSISWGRLPSMLTPMDQPFAEMGYLAAVLLGSPAAGLTPPRPPPKEERPTNQPHPRLQDITLTAKDTPPLAAGYVENEVAGPLGALTRAVRWLGNFNSGNSGGSLSPAGTGVEGLATLLGALPSAVSIWLYSKRWPIAAMVFPTASASTAATTISSSTDEKLFRVYVMLGRGDGGGEVDDPVTNWLQSKTFSFFPPVSREAERLKDDLLARLNMNTKNNTTRMVFLGLAKAVDGKLLPDGTQQGMEVPGITDSSTTSTIPTPCSLYYVQRVVSVCPQMEEITGYLQKLLVAGVGNFAAHQHPDRRREAPDHQEPSQREEAGKQSLLNEE
jgi:tRNA pseudouridine(55) synthase